MPFGHAVSKEAQPVESRVSGGKSSRGEPTEDIRHKRGWSSVAYPVYNWKLLCSSFWVVGYNP